jgi:predicted TIM-barrel fold metal-dependent hydrolase
MNDASIDFHVHCLRLNHPLAQVRPRQGHHQPLRDATADELIRLMDAHNVAKAVVVAPSFYGFDNTLVLEALRQYPGRLFGTVIVPWDVDFAGLQRMRAAGVAGMRLHLFRRQKLPDLGSQPCQRFFGMLRELGMHVELIVEGDLMPAVLPHLYPSGVRVMLDHFGMPNAQTGAQGQGFQCVLESVARGNTWVKLSAPFLLGGREPQEYIDALLAHGAQQRLVWGSDWPWVGHEDAHTYAECLEWLADCIPDPATRQAVLFCNANELLEAKP